MIEFKKPFSLFGNSEAVMPFVWMNEGSFEVGITGSSKIYLASDYKLFKTGLSKGYWIAQYPVTQSQWQKLGFELKNWHNPSNLDSPIYGISWLGAMKYCRALNLMHQNDIPDGYHFSLPTELHWEYACQDTRQGLYKPFHFPFHDDEYGLGMPNPFCSIVRQPPDSIKKYSYLNENNVFWIPDYLSEWCFDIAAYYGDDNTWDWIGNQEDFWLWDSSSTRYPNHRAIRGSSSETGLREYANYYMGDHQDNPGFTPAIIGFRVCLRPITLFDIEDPILQKYYINILG